MSENEKPGDFGKAAGEGLKSIGDYGKVLDEVGKELDKVNEGETKPDSASGTATTNP